MTRPVLLDLYCGAGGASVGYDRAGFRVIGVDIEPQPEYPFEFHKWDALDFPVGQHIDAVHASPPCQAFSTMTRKKADHPDLVDATRSKLLATRLPFVIENVPTAPLRKDVVLCGLYFGLEVIRHRVFEVHGFECPQPPHTPCKGAVRDGRAISVTGTGGGTGIGDGRGRRKQFEGLTVVESRQRAMGIDWMKNNHSLAEAIPPAYAEYVGRHLYEAVTK